MEILKLIGVKYFPDGITLKKFDKNERAYHEKNSYH